MNKIYISCILASTLVGVIAGYPSFVRPVDLQARAEFCKKESLPPKNGSWSACMRNAGFYWSQ